MIKQAIILAAGRGARFRPVTDSIPKPLVRLAGKALIDWQLELLHLSGIERVIINCCYLKELLIEHVQATSYGFKELAFSEEETALETGGGIKKALPFFHDEPFFAVNSDVVISPSNAGILQQLTNAFDKKPLMQVALLLQPMVDVIGLQSKGDFFCNEYGVLKRRGLQPNAPFIFTGVQLLNPQIFSEIDSTIFSMNMIYDEMLENSPSHIAGIINLQGTMLHVGDVEGHNLAEDFLK
jgi:N-acetyl-alpha-D-muramate 1-phosphate uridylyltransferase